MISGLDRRSELHLKLRGHDCLQRWEWQALGDANMRLLQKGVVVQLERKGYFIVDEALVRTGKPMVLFAIPDGRHKSVLPPLPVPALPSVLNSHPLQSSSEGVPV